MESTEEVDWFGNAGVGGPSLEDFLASDAAQLPFMNMEHGTFTGINEDRVCYQLFADTWESIDHLHELLESVLQLAESLTSGYIWHHDPFSLSIKVAMGGDLEPHLEGSQVVGENASDEWFACYLLYTITKAFPELTACVSDNDGEFLLIDAATAIPPFLSPANSQHRVWIKSGEVHLVMPGCMVDRGRTPRTLGSGKITQMEGLKAVREGDGATVADEGVQRLIRRRVEVYPDKAARDMHRARCFLPPSVALALRHSPELVSTAVRFYCSGDPTDRKAGVRMTRLLPRPATDRSLCGTSDSSSTSMNDSTGEPVASRFVEFRVTFTRHLYAQLHQAPVVPAPKVFPATWGAVGDLPPAAHLKAAHLGQKLSMGLEAAYQSCAKRCRQRDVGDMHEGIKVEKWKRMMDGLKRNGFFEGEIEGSKRYREKTAIAEQFVRDSTLKVEDEQAATAQGEHRHCAVQETVDRVLKDLGNGFPIDFEPLTEEDDKEDWLEVSQAELDAVFQEYRCAETGLEPSGSADTNDRSGESSRVKTSSVHGESRDKNEGDCQVGFESAANDLDDLVMGMHMFVADTTAGPDGAEVEAVAGDVQFDVDKFMSLLNGADLRSALDEAADADFDADFMPLSDDEADHRGGDDGDDDDLIEKPSRMVQPSTAKNAPSGKSLSVNEGRAQEMDTSSCSLKSNGHEERKVSFKLIESEEPDSDDEVVEPASAEFHTRAAKKDDASVTEHKSGAPASFLREYMTAMELELDPSSLGESFNKVGDYHSELDMEKLRAVGPLDQVEAPVAKLWLADDVSESKPDGDGAHKPPTDADADTAEEYKPVDVDMNMVKHLLESTAAQGGLSGPASNLLRSMGLSFPSVPVGSGVVDRNELQQDSHL